MSILVRRIALALLSAVAAIAAAASLPAEAKGGFKPFFVAKLPGEPKGASSWKATTKAPIGNGTGFIYNDANGSIALTGVTIKPGLTTTNVLMTVNVFAGMDLTGVTFPVSRPAAVALSYSKTKIKLSDPTNPKITAYTYSADSATGVTLTVNSYDPATGEITGTLSGNMVFHENAQDPNDDARDGEVVALKNAKFALKSLQ